MDITQLENMLPKNECSLTLEHNPHKDIYLTVQEWIELTDESHMYQWKDDADKQEAISTDELWTLQWYTDTPIGFYAVAASTISKLLDLANEPD